ncbi:MAG TPA: RsmB/NOP family class I SAM-dependent RNA methyltransferase [Allosphingosinicella sp.]|nr:RsmB/NOP family class I SAM-dependent RNA methyltransferase [Allosphingosinicella sp.]
MIPAARAQAAIEILDQVIAAARDGGPAADTLVSRYFASRRYAGSKDRRAVRDLVYRAIRASAERPDSGRAALLRVASGEPELLASFDGSRHGPAPVAPGDMVEAGESPAVPAWLIPRLDPCLTPDEWPALLDRAPLDLRVNRLKGTREAAIAKLPEAVPTPLSPIGLRLPEGFRVEEDEAWSSGLVEIQDEGSQLLALACAAEPGMAVLDLCAGAGGKTLALAAGMDDDGRLIASDTDRARLARMAPRLDRAGVTIVEARLLDPGREKEALGDLAGALDLVLVDAPCSGTGTWRRNPELRWRLTPERLSRFVEAQARLLDLAASFVRPGGAIVHAICSILAEEGRGQAAAFSSRSALVPEEIAIPFGRAAGPGRLLSPGRDGTDGFFVARWRAPC